MSKGIDKILPELIRLYEWLQIQGSATAMDMVDELGMPRATVYRYLKYLEAMVGPGGITKDGNRFRLIDAPFRIVRLDANDKNALAVAGRLLDIIGMPYRAEFKRLFVRLCGYDQQRADTEREAVAAQTDRHLAFTEPHVCRPLEDQGLVTRLYDLCCQRPRRPIRFDYRSLTTPSEQERLVWPVGLIFNNAWFLLGFDPAKTPHYRVYAVDRISRVREALLSGSDPVGEYHVGEHLQHAWRLIVGGGQPQEVELVLPLRLANEQKHSSQQVLTVEGDRARVLFAVSEPLEMVPFIMAHAHEIDVVRPAAVREAVRQRLTQALERLSSG